MISYASIGFSAVNILVLLALCFAGCYVMCRLAVQDKLQKRRLDLVESALKSGAVDAATKSLLLAALAEGAKGGRSEPRASPLFALGWIGLCAGIAMIVIYYTAPASRGTLPAGVITCAISFGLLSLPMAARELYARTHSHAGGQAR
jgi:hypothetical protein